METNNRSRLQIPLSEPHFDEEATLMTAQPVVPLQEVHAEARWRRGLIFVVALIVAIAIGSGAGAIVHKYRSAQETDDLPAGQGTLEHTSAPAIVGGAGGAAIDAADESVAVNTEGSEEPSVTTDTEQQQDLPKVKAKQTSPASNSRTAGNVAVDDDQREARREQRREARRHRRDAEHEARRNSDDLLRIREIFEGAPRP